jgi:hypothetical protein
MPRNVCRGKAWASGVSPLVVFSFTRRSPLGITLTRVILARMKIAVSIPEEIFRRSESLAKSMGLSRSEVYTRALTKFVAEHDEAEITESLNRVYAKQDSSLDPIIEKMQLISLPVERW